ncbi:MAG: hypothetical protein QG608_2123 [Actinomycetota bacterium]|nr:hypothetical protein [Actinomycetota bacterium]
MDQESDPWTAAQQADDLSVMRSTQVGTLPAAEVQEEFNGPLQPRDPADLLGIRLDGFALNYVQPLPSALVPRAEQLRSDIYLRLRQNLTQAPGARLNSLSVDYSDEKVRYEESRRYIRVQMRTVRDTQVTTLFRCYTAGPYLYVAADSYRLGGLRISALVLRLLVTLMLFVWALPAAIFTFGSSLVFFAVFFWWSWRTVVRGAMSGRTADALRSVFPKTAKESSFDLDDILIYLKTLMPSITASFRESCAHHGVDLTSIDEAIVELNKKISSTEPATVINNYGSIKGSIFGGSRNAVRGG